MKPTQSDHGNKFEINGKRLTGNHRHGNDKGTGTALGERPGGLHDEKSEKKPQRTRSICNRNSVNA